MACWPPAWIGQDGPGVECLASTNAGLRAWMAPARRGVASTPGHLRPPSSSRVVSAPRPTAWMAPARAPPAGGWAVSSPESCAPRSPPREFTQVGPQPPPPDVALMPLSCCLLGGQPRTRQDSAVQGRVASVGVVEGMDVVRHGSSGFVLVGPVPGLVDEFLLQRAEERRGHGVVPAVALAAHGWHRRDVGQRGLVCGAGVLRAAVAVVNEPFVGLTSRHRLVQRPGCTALVSMCDASAQPTTFRLNRSMSTARYTQPAWVCRYVMSPTQA